MFASCRCYFLFQSEHVVLIYSWSMLLVRSWWKCIHTHTHTHTHTHIKFCLSVLNNLLLYIYIEELLCWNSRGQLKKKCNFQGCSKCVTQLYRIFKSKALFCPEFTRVKVEFLGMIKKKSCWIFMSLHIWHSNSQGVQHKFTQFPRVRKDLFRPDFPRVKWQT